MKRYKMITCIIAFALLLTTGICCFFGTTNENLSITPTGDKFDDSVKRFEKKYESLFPGKDFFVNLNYSTTSLLKIAADDTMDYTNNHVIKLPNGTLYSYDDNLYLQAPFTADFYTSSASELKELYSLLQKEGIEFTYALAPSRSPENDITLPYGFSDYSNSNREAFISMSIENDIPIIDLTKGLQDSSLDRSQWFYSTDHHWTTRSSIISVQYTLQQLNSLYNESFDSSLIDFDNLIFENYAESFVGSIGVRVSLEYPKEQFEIAYPKNDTSFKYTVKTANTSFTFEGDAKEAFFDREMLDNSDYLNKYSVNLHDVSYEAIIENNLLGDGKKCLLISDSFGRNYAQFLSLYFSTVAYVDPQPGRYADSIRQYVATFNPDVVIYLCNGQDLYHSINLS